MRGHLLGTAPDPGDDRQHRPTDPRLPFRRAELLREREADDIVVFGGGIIPDEDIPVLEEKGLAKIFTPGASLTEIADWVNASL